MKKYKIQFHSTCKKKILKLLYAKLEKNADTLFFNVDLKTKPTIALRTQNFTLSKYGAMMAQI